MSVRHAEGRRSTYKFLIMDASKVVNNPAKIL